MARVLRSVPILLFGAIGLLLTVPREAALAQDLTINEFLASNDGAFLDADGDSSDWLEIYSADAVPVNLLGYGLTDDASRPFRWVLPDVTIPPGGFLLIWASGKDRTTGELHTNFSLDKDGEFIGLYHPDGTLIDGFPFDVQIPGVSQGRKPDGGPFQEFFNSPTPGAANTTLARSAPPIFSLPGGFYASPQSLTITSTESGAVIRYTTDGNDPVSSSAVYPGPLGINSTIVVRARVFAPGKDPSPIVSASYLFSSPGNIASLSLVTDPDNLWDPATGIYVNFNERGDSWERPVSAEFIFDQTAAIRIDGGIRLHGGRGTRWLDKKSFRLYFDYGAVLDYPLFPEKPIQSYRRLVLRASGHDGAFHPDGGPIWTLLRDPVMNELFREHEPLAVGQVPVRLYLNGQPWGIYWIVERIDQYFIADNTGWDRGEFDLVKGTQPQTGAPFTELRDGSMDEWERMTAFLDSHDLSIPAHYETASRMIDVDRMVRHLIIEMWAGNWDWPHMNIYWARPRVDTGLWRWIPWDSDISFNALPHHPDMYRHMDGAHDEREDWSTLAFRRMQHNPEFRTLFVNRVADLLDTTLKPTHVAGVVDQMADRIRADIAFETNRWGSTASVWESNINNMKTWAASRETAFRNYTRNHFASVTGWYPLILNVQGEGAVRAGAVTVTAFPWSGSQFTGVPVTLEALPAPGWTFTRWEGAALPDAPRVALSGVGPQSITAVFEPRTAWPQPNDVLINEYWNNDDGTVYDTLGGRPLSGDWVELLVAAPGGADLRNWRLTNNNTKASPEPDAGSVYFPPLAALADLPRGTVILVIADAEGDNPAHFMQDDLDPSDGRLLFYVGNGNLDVTTDPRFTIKNSNEALVLLAPGPTASMADDIGVDFIAEGNTVTPASFGVAGDGVVFVNPFSGIGDDDGAIFTGSSNNDDGVDPVQDDLPGIGGWIVDPPAQFTGDAPGAIQILSPGAQNPGQALGAFPTPPPAPTPTPTPSVQAEASVLRIGRAAGGIQLYLAAADVALVRDQRPGRPAVGLTDRSGGASRAYWGPSGYDLSPGYLDGTQCGSSGEVRGAVGYCTTPQRLSPVRGNLTLAKPDLSGVDVVFPLDSYVSYLTNADTRTPFNESAAAYPAWVKYRIRSPELLNRNKAYLWFRQFKPSRQIDGFEERVSDDSVWIVGSPEPSVTDRTLFYLANDGDGPGDNDGPDRSGATAILFNNSGVAERGMDQWFWGGQGIDNNSNLNGDWCGNASRRIGTDGNRCTVLWMTRPDDGQGNGVLEFYLVGREAEHLQEAHRLDLLCVSTAGYPAFTPTDDTWETAEIVNHTSATYWTTY